jgi:hypothetical protein
MEFGVLGSFLDIGKRVVYFRQDPGHYKKVIRTRPLRMLEIASLSTIN